MPYLNKSKVAHIIMAAFGIYVMAPESIWKRSHDYHHKHNSKLFTSSIGSYQIITKEKFLTALSRSEKYAYLVSRHPVTIVFGYFSMFMIGMAMQSYLSSPKKHKDSLIALIVHLLLNIIVFYFLRLAGLAAYYHHSLYSRRCHWCLSFLRPA